MLALIAALLLSQTEEPEYKPDYTQYPEQCRPPNVEPAFVRDCATRLHLKKLSAEYDASKAVADAADEAASKACGDDYLELRVGMTWKRAKQCGGAYSLVGEDETGHIYQFNGATVRVSRGKVRAVVVSR